MSTPTAPESRSSGGNVFTRKVGPLPMWGWMAIALVLAFVFYLYKKHTSSSSSTSSGSNSATNNSPGGVDSSLVPQFVNQTYVNGSPPAAPSITNNTTTTTDSNDTNSNNSAPVSVGGNTVATKPPTTTKVSYITYKVKAGDTLQSLSKKYGVTVEQIASAPGNVYVSGEVAGNKKVGQQLGTGAGLKTGMTLKIPQYTTVAG
jgi:LysM repeat protein